MLQLTPACIRRLLQDSFLSLNDRLYANVIVSDRDPHAIYITVLEVAHRHNVYQAINY